MCLLICAGAWQIEFRLSLLLNNRRRLKMKGFVTQRADFEKAFLVFKIQVCAA
jgi:hypothetical protein